MVRTCGTCDLAPCCVFHTYASLQHDPGMKRALKLTVVGQRYGDNLFANRVSHQTLYPLAVPQDFRSKPAKQQIHALCLPCSHLG